MEKKRRLWDEYRFPGFHPRAEVKGIFGDPKARIIPLQRRQKKLYAEHAGACVGVSTTGRRGGYGIWAAGKHGFTWRWRFDGYSVGSARG
jgi:hypothetical protein